MSDWNPRQQISVPASDNGRTPPIPGQLVDLVICRFTYTFLTNSAERCLLLVQPTTRSRSLNRLRPTHVEQSYDHRPQHHGGRRGAGASRPLLIIAPARGRSASANTQKTGDANTEKNTRGQTEFWKECSQENTQTCRRFASCEKNCAVAQ